MPDVTPELEQAKARAEERLLALPGVTGVDVGFKEVGGEPTDQLAIRVLVREKKPLEDVPGDERIPDEIEGHPSDVIQRRFELHSTGAYVAAAEVLPPVDAGAYNPLRGGVSVGPCRSVGGFVHAGTLGAIVVDNASGRYLALSNFHVLAVDGDAAEGDTMAQPSLVDGGRCPAQVAGRLRRHALTGAVDAAVMDLGRDARPEVVEIGAVTGIGTAALGHAVYKRGRSTRLTYGVVDSVSLTLNVDYGHDIGVRTLTGQIGVRPDPARSVRFSAKGDSGAVLLGDAREVVGLLFAGDDTGYGVANPIAEVLSALDISVAIGPAAKRVELFSSKVEPEFKDRFGGKERKSDKTEFKDNKDQKNEAKEDKDLKNETKEDKDFKDGKDDKDKEGKDEDKESKDKEFKQELKEFKSEGKDERKDGKDDKDKQEKDEFKEAKDEHKDNKDDKDTKDKDKDAKDQKDLQLELFPQGAPKDYQVDVKPNKLEGKDIKSEKPEQKDVRLEVKQPKQEIKERIEKPVNEFPWPDPFRLPVERRVAALETAVTRLSHFIGRALRPDLSQGALHQEPDATTPPQEEQ